MPQTNYESRVGSIFLGSEDFKRLHFRLIGLSIEALVYTYERWKFHRAEKR